MFKAPRGRSISSRSRAFHFVSIGDVIKPFELYLNRTTRLVQLNPALLLLPLNHSTTIPTMATLAQDAKRIEKALTKEEKLDAKHVKAAEKELHTVEKDHEKLIKVRGLSLPLENIFNNLLGWPGYS